jgi:VWFA-related protein
MRTLLVALFCVVAIAAPARSQAPAGQPPADQPPVQGPTFKTGIDLIAVDVAVVDSRGRPVEDLRAPDFSVKIDGEPRRVVSAELFKVNAAEAKKQAAEKTETFYTSNLTPPNARLIVIAIDQINIQPASIKPLISAASKFLDQLSPLDQVAFVTYPELGTRVNFTTDRLRIRLAMQNLIGQSASIPATQLNIGVVEAMAIEAKRDQSILNDVVARECSRLDPAMRAQCEREIITESTRIAERIRENTSASIRGLKDLLTQLSFVDGPKSLILISEGLATDDSSDLAALAAAAGRARTSINVMLVDLSRGDVTINEPSPTASQDRQLQMQGLQGLAVMSRGALFHIVGTGEQIFDRLASEISAYYLLGVEQRPGDERTERRRIDVEVRRRDVTIRSRQAYVLSPTATARRQSADESLRDALISPFAVSGVPLRVTTFAQQDPANDKVQLMVAAQVGAPGTTPGDYDVGFLLIDDQNKVAASFSGKRTLTPIAGTPTEPLAFLGGVTVDPGIYNLRFGVVDAEGRRGSVFRDVNAWKLAGEEFAPGDLVVGNLPPAGEGLRASVEPHITSDTLAMFVELYSTASATWDRTTVTFEVADDENAPAIATLDARMAPGRQATWRSVTGVLGAKTLPAGPYVARAQIRRDGKLIGSLARPFVLERAEGTRVVAPVAVAAAAVSFAGSLPKFDPKATLQRDVVGAMLDITEKRSPALKALIAEARAGRYGPAALDALAEGDQTTAAFLRGLDFFVKGQFDQAATQLDIASGPRREFFPAAFYLGAAFAAAGRDRDAAGIWQLALGQEARPAAIYPMIADARMRDGQAQSAIDILKPAYDRAPADDEIGRRLGMAYVMTGQFADAVPILDGYLTRHPAEQDVLLAAIVAQYEVTRGGQALSSVDRAKLRRYATAYRGAEQVLVEKYLATLQVR